LGEAGRRGRRDEFAAFGWQAEPPDPQDETTFLRVKLNHKLRLDGRFNALLQFYRQLIRLRKELAPLARLSKEDCEVIGFENERVLVLIRRSEGEQVLLAFNFNHSQSSISLPLSEGRWYRVLDSTDLRWHGAGSTLPPEVQIHGALKLALPSKSVAVLARSGDDPGKSFLCDPA